MLPVSPEVLSLSSDAVLLVRGGRVAYANPRAEALLGRALAGLKSSELFGEDILGSQADSFAADALVCGRYCSLRTLRIADARVYYLQSPELTADYVSDAFICSARGLLMNMRLSIDLLRRNVQEDAVVGLVCVIQRTVRHHEKIL